MNEKLKQMKAMPISLMLEGRPCLVVGGGKVALRKAQHLLDVGATVTVICPDLCEGFPESDVVYHDRKFIADDVAGHVLVFAATNDRYVNRQILEACRKQHILCSCVDGNWADSDFATPAIARHGELLLTVSTGGQSCRQAKMVKDSLAKHLTMIESAELVVVGTDHHHLSIDEREPFHLPGPRQHRAGFMLMQLWGVHEFMILNTCNRVEIVAVVSHETAHNGILRHILGFDRLDEDQFYIHRGYDAFQHIALAVSGMLSQTPGETHVSAQFKEAFSFAQQQGWAGSFMQEWVSVFQHISKHIQTDVVSESNADEIEDLTVHYLQDQVEDLRGKTLIVLGAGMVGQGLVQDALPLFKKVICCYHKTRPDIADAKGCLELCTFNGLKDRLGDADLVISATDAPGYVLHQGHAPFFDQEKSITLIDLGMPRNIDPALRELSADLTLVDLDGLKHWQRKNSAGLDRMLSQCNQIVEEHREQYERICTSFQSRNA